MDSNPPPLSKLSENKKNWKFNNYLIFRNKTSFLTYINKWTHIITFSYFLNVFWSFLEELSRLKIIFLSAHFSFVSVFWCIWSLKLRIYKVFHANSREIMVSLSDGSLDYNVHVCKRKFYMLKEFVHIDSTVLASFSSHLRNVF